MHRAIHDWIGILMTHFSTASGCTWIKNRPCHASLGVLECKLCENQVWRAVISLG